MQFSTDNHVVFDVSEKVEKPDRHVEVGEVLDTLGLIVLDKNKPIAQRFDAAKMFLDYHSAKVLDAE